MEPDTTPTQAQNKPRGPTAAIIIIVLILLVGGVYFFSKGLGFSKAISANDIAWGFDTVAVAKGQTPTTKITLRVKDKEYDAGTYEGNCAQVAPTVLLENEIAGAVCLFSGHGDEIGVFKEGLGYTVRHGDIVVPNETSKGSRDGFVPLFNL